MAEQILVDNDVILKVVVWHLHEEMLGLLTVEGTSPSVLGVARYVIGGRLTRIPEAFRAEALDAFEELWARISSVEPNDEEISTAAEFEATASSAGLELDGGESQLLAVLLHREAKLLVTGDKRAIHAMALIAPKDASGRVACIEQAIRELVRLHGVPHLRARICEGATADKALAICFACSRPSEPTDAEVHEGLTSYAESVRRSAPEILVSDMNLAAILSG